MNTSQKQFIFTFNKTIEFQNTLLALSSGNEFYEFLEENNIKVDNKVHELINKMKNKLTQYMNWELNYFFYMGDFNLFPIGKMIYMHYVIKNPNINNVYDFLNIIEKSNTKEIVKIIFAYQYYFNENKIEKQKMQLEEITNNIEEMIKIINNTKFKTNSVKQKIIECIENPEETKQRYCLMLKQIYEKVYKEFENEIEELIIKKINVYETIFFDNPQNFTKQYIKTDYNVFGNAVNIHISFFWNLGFEYWPNNTSEELVILGVDTKKMYENIPKKEKIYSFLKTLSDKSRLEIIELLSERDWYVNELAEKLNISTATISYHLSRLQDLNIVDYRRCDQRFYYFLIKENLKELFEQASKALINE